MALWPFTDLLPQQAEFTKQVRDSYISAIAHRLAQNSQIWIFRPHLGPLLEALRVAKERGEITGCFILTNNGSALITECVRQMLNIRAGAELFVVGWYRYTPCRRKAGSILTKNLRCIQECLRASGLPTLNRSTDLLYFDDSPTHALAMEIPPTQYITVKAYFHYTPINIVYKELKGVIAQFGVDTHIVEKVLKKGIQQEANDLKEDIELIQNRPASAESFSLLEAFQNFLQIPSSVRSSKSGVTRRMTKGTTKSVTTQKTRLRRGGRSQKMRQGISGGRKGRVF